jgi:hypothetical protein
VARVGDLLKQMIGENDCTLTPDAAADILLAYLDGKDVTCFVGCHSRPD